MNYHRLRTLLERHYGWATEAIHDREIDNAIQALAYDMSLAPSAASDRIGAMICQDSKLLAKIAESLAVHETWFFRGYEQLQHAVDHLASTRIQMARASDSLPLRVLSAPCSTGEEAYSLALLLSQRGLTHRDVVIDGLDQSQRVIERAKTGSYGNNSFREPLWDKPNRIPGIHAVGDRWDLDRNITTMVRFQVANLLDIPSPPALYDCIFCRNLLIYLSPAKRIELLRRLGEWLTPQGRIYVSAVEAPIAQEAGLTAIAPRELQIFAPSRAHTPHAEPSHSSFPIPRHRPSPSLDRLSPKNRVAPRPSTTSVLNKVETLLTPDLQPDLLRAEQAADAGRFAEAEAILNALPASERLSASAQFLRGVIAQAQGKMDQAQYAWEQTVYLDPQHGPALQRLWLAATARGDIRLAEQYRRRWLKRRIES